MEIFSIWQFWAILGFFLILGLLWFFRRGSSASKNNPIKTPKTALYEDIIGLLQLYTDQVEQLAHEYRYAFNHADKLTPESEETAEKIITALEITEKHIREKTNQLVLLNESDLANTIIGLLFPERNIRHSSPRELEAYTETARPKSLQLIQKMRENLN